MSPSTAPAPEAAALTTHTVYDGVRKRWYSQSVTTMSSTFSTGFILEWFPACSLDVVRAVRCPKSRDLTCTSVFSTRVGPPCLTEQLSLNVAFALRRSQGPPRKETSESDLVLDDATERTVHRRILVGGSPTSSPLLCGTSRSPYGTHRYCCDHNELLNILLCQGARGIGTIGARNTSRLVLTWARKLLSGMADRGGG